MQIHFNHTCFVFIIHLLSICTMRCTVNSVNLSIYFDNCTGSSDDYSFTYFRKHGLYSFEWLQNSMKICSTLFVYLNEPRKYLRKISLDESNVYDGTTDMFESNMDHLVRRWIAFLLNLAIVYVCQITKCCDFSKITHREIALCLLARVWYWYL